MYCGSIPYFGRTGDSFNSIKLGEVELASSMDANSKSAFSNELQNTGFSLINDRKSQLIEQMKSLVVNKILTVESNGASEDDVKNTLRKIGFTAESVNSIQ